MKNDGTITIKVIFCECSLTLNYFYILCFCYLDF